MGDSDFSRNRHSEHLGVNKLGKNIRKSPLHQPNLENFSNNSKPQPPQPHVYNISKNDFRNVVQQLTGSPSHSHASPRPPKNPPKPPSMRLQKIRPPPLTPFAQLPQVPQPPMPGPAFNGSFTRPVVGAQQGVPPQLLPIAPTDPIWSNTAESPISAYMRYLQNSMIDQSPRQAQGLGQPPSSGLLPTPPAAAATFPSPRGNVPPLLPSPTSPFPLPSPTSFLNLLSPMSPYPLLSPRFQFPPLTPNLLSPFPHPGVLGPGPHPPHSPTFLFPPSPSGFFSLSSPRWKDQ
ncbi:hypothetical protein Scep_026770 [Stephania cephalantha]|uniref:VQ domain-containing protein n=1 Tax=Stephania cephalantha TaxID=152367 RepID=A0AAP0EKS7_9MAGN